MLELFFLGMAAHRAASLEQMNKHLEEDLDIALCLIRRMATQLRPMQEAEALGPAWDRFLAACDPIAQSELVAHYDALVKQKQQSQALRELRERLGLSWDQVFDLFEQWSKWDQTKKLRLLQRVELRHLFFALNDPDASNVQQNDYPDVSRSSASTPSP